MWFYYPKKDKAWLFICSIFLKTYLRNSLRPKSGLYSALVIGVAISSADRSQVGDELADSR